MRIFDSRFSNFDWRTVRRAVAARAAALGQGGAINEKCCGRLRQIQGAANWNRQMAVDALNVIPLRSCDSFGHRVRHESVYRTAVIAARPEHSLEGRYVSGIPEQFVPRFEVVVETRSGPRKIVGLVHLWHLVKPAPFVPRSQRIFGMEQRVVIEREGWNSEDNERQDEQSESFRDHSDVQI